MSKCRQIVRNNSKACIGDMRSRIKLHSRSIRGQVNSVDFGVSLPSSVTVWASVETVKGEDVFDGTEILGTATHRFYIRWRSDITSQTWVEYGGEYYRVLDVINFEERDRFMALRCAVRGDTAKDTNLK